MRRDLTWGTVNGTSPLAIRIAGDTRDTALGKKLDSTGTLAVGDVVMLARGGSGGWVVIGKVVTS